MTLAHRDDPELLAQQMLQLQTNGQAFREDMQMLQGILTEQPAWVRDTINRFLQEEEARTFQNVVGQIEDFRKMLSEIAELCNSEDAVALRHLIKDIHPSNMRGLQREAQSIGEEMEGLRICIGNQDWEAMYGLMQRSKNKVRRFRDKFAELRPKLDRLAEKVAQLATKCEENANQAEELKQEVEARRDGWLWLLETITWLIGICSGVGLAASGVTAVLFSVVVYLKSLALPAAMHAATEASKAAMAAKAAAAGCGGYVVAGGAGGAVAGGAGGGAAAAALGAPAATLFGSEALGGLAVSAGLMATPAAPLGLVAGVASAAAAVGTLFGSVIGHASSASAAAAASKAAAAAATAATANAQVASLQGVIALLSGLCTPFMVSTAVVLALFMLGWLGRDLLKRLLGRLWAAEIQSHEQCANKWRELEQELKTAGQLLRNSTEGCEKLETCLDEVYEAAEHACEILEDNNTHPLYPERDLATLTSTVDEFCSRYESVIPAFEHFQDQVMSLQDHVNNSACLSRLLSVASRPLTHHSNLPIEDDSISALSMIENVQADGSSGVSMLQLQVEVNEGAGNSHGPRVEEVTLGPRGLPQICPQAAAVPSPAAMPVEPASIPSLADHRWILVEFDPLS